MSGVGRKETSRVFHWIPTPLWYGRRWELVIEEGGVRLEVGRVVRFDDELIEAAVTGFGHFRPVKGPHATLQQAAEVLVRATRELRLDKKKGKKP